MKYEIHRVYGVSQQITPHGALACNELSAYAMDESSILAKLDRPRIALINPDGIMLSGFEEAGVTKTGVQKYKYSEWFCRYLP